MGSRLYVLFKLVIGIGNKLHRFGCPGLSVVKDFVGVAYDAHGVKAFLQCPTVLRV